MLYDLSSHIDIQKFKAKNSFAITNKKMVEFKVKTKSRSTLQNAALHLFYTMISDQLNEMGIDFSYSGLNNNQFNIPHTPDIVKEFIWRPIQIAMFNIESTTKIDTHQINAIVDVIVKYFGDKGIVMEFPSIESLMNKE